MPVPPKPPDQRRRRNAVPGGERTPTMPEPVYAPDALPRIPGVTWHVLAVAYFESVKASAQSRFFEPSDWAMTIELCLAITRLNRSKRFGAELFSQVWNAMKDLEGTDVARRKAHLFVTRPLPGAAVEEEVPENVTPRERYRAKLEQKEANG